ncbi:hypothetical protein GCM10027048_17680 [Hymenobacter coalescens]
MNLLPSALIRSVLLALVGVVLFAGCCGSVACNCQNYRADALVFQFSADTSGGANRRGFTAAEVDTVLIVRSVYPRDSAATARADTARIIRPAATTPVSTPVVIDNTEPFASLNGRKLGYPNPDSSYRYRILLPQRGPGRVRLPQTSYYISRVALDGQLDGDGCCTCYRNTRKQFRLSRFSASGRRDTLVDATTPSGSAPAVFVLRR